MDERRVPFREWEGEYVMVGLTNGTTPSGVLEEVNELGLVLRHALSIWWNPAQNEPDEEGYSRSKHVDRLVSEFYPWTAVFTVRVLEPDEAVERGF